MNHFLFIMTDIYIKVTLVFLPHKYTEQKEKGFQERGGDSHPLLFVNSYPTE